ncbi:hypothetical protein [Halosimplex sp. TS25]|uniref:hypothetical protein n=1 Tax=Halosimplex rarum TaxID=3396619 RepID=UPI0039ED4534
MLRLAAAVFLVLHGVVHGWYVVLSQGWVEVEEQMGWTGHSWLLSSVLPRETVLALGSVSYVLVALGFVAAGVGVALDRPWWRPVLVGSALVSTAVIVALWDGEFDLLVEKGAVGVLINLALVAYVLAVG